MCNLNIHIRRLKNNALNLVFYISRDRLQFNGIENFTMTETKNFKVLSSFQHSVYTI